VRSIGEVTDIVGKEMYTFPDRNGESMTLRPEATAGIVRAAIEHNFLYNGPMRVWTSGPMFRYEKPQKGRQREFYQYDVEALGFEGPDVDAEQIVMLGRLWKALGIGPVALHVNSIGDAADRKVFRERLVTYFSKHEGELDEDSKKRLHANPLRILDSKNPAMQALIAGRSRLEADLGEAGGEALRGIAAHASRRGLGLHREPAAGARHGLLQSHGVRVGLRQDRAPSRPSRAAAATMGCSSSSGGKPTPATGFGMGMERVLLTMQACGAAASVQPDVFVVHAGEAAAREGWKLAEWLRDQGRTVVMGNGGSFKSQMKKADARVRAMPRSSATTKWAPGR
jgi:histidyl-tRNA synthetase